MQHQNHRDYLLSAVVGPPPPSMLSGHSQSIEMSAMVTALTHVVSGQRQGGADTSSYLPSGVDSPTSCLFLVELWLMGRAEAAAPHKMISFPTKLRGFIGESCSSVSNPPPLPTKKPEKEEENTEEFARDRGANGRPNTGPPQKPPESGSAPSTRRNPPPEPTTRRPSIEATAPNSTSRKTSESYRHISSPNPHVIPAAAVNPPPHSSAAVVLTEHRQGLLGILAAARSSGGFQPQQSTTLFEQMFYASSLAGLYSHSLNTSSPSSSSSSAQPALYPSSTSSPYPMLFSSGQTIHFAPQGNNQQTQGGGGGSSNFPHRRGL
ncbi:hypothetical protein DH2020_047402 [Rehmannia glutinosa]|uniref:Uncharacterized protein n=1 Tax=Rehmannia glutinosa TaxID=99300 RepID=A0ABR0U9K9_REHGL